MWDFSLILSFLSGDLLYFAFGFSCGGSYLFGRKLVEEALDFCRDAGYSSVFLWTVNTLPIAASSANPWDSSRQRS